MFPESRTARHGRELRAESRLCFFRAFAVCGLLLGGHECMPVYMAEKSSVCTPSSADSTYHPTNCPSWDTQNSCCCTHRSWPRVGCHGLELCLNVGQDLASQLTHGQSCVHYKDPPSAATIMPTYFLQVDSTTCTSPPCFAYSGPYVDEHAPINPKPLNP